MGRYSSDVVRNALNLTQQNRSTNTLIKMSQKCNWNGIEFPSRNECARVLDVQKSTLLRHKKKYDSLDRVKPGRNSKYYKPPTNARNKQKRVTAKSTKPITWRDKVFPSRSACAEFLGYTTTYICDVFNKEGTIDDLSPKERGRQPNHAKNKVLKPRKSLVNACKPCQYRGKNFTSQKALAKHLGYTVTYISGISKSVGSFDHLTKNKKHKYKGKYYESLKALADDNALKYSKVKYYYSRYRTYDRADANRTNTYKRGVARSVVWRDVPFESISACAKTLCVNPDVIRGSLKKFSTIDHLVPGYKSVYYSKSEDPREQHCFINEAIDIFGLKAVARMYGCCHTTMRRARSQDHGLLAFRVERWEGTQHKYCKFKTRDDLFRAMVSPPRRPYVYLLRWSKQNINYVGSRTAEFCKPEEINKTYFSSSRKVAAFIRQHGKPDVTYTIEYAEVNQALFAEGFCLMLLSASPRHIKHYLNKVLWIPNQLDPWLCRGTRNDFLVRCGDGELKRKRQLLELLLQQ